MSFRFNELGEVPYDTSEQDRRRIRRIMRDHDESVKELDRRVQVDGLHWQVVALASSTRPYSIDEASKDAIYHGGSGPCMKLSVAVPDGFQWDISMIAKMDMFIRMVHKDFDEWVRQQETKKREENKL